MHAAYGRGSVLLWQSDEREGSVLGVFFLNENALRSIAFDTHIRTAEPIKVSFRMMSELGPTDSVT